MIQLAVFELPQLAPPETEMNLTFQVQIVDLGENKRCCCFKLLCIEVMCYASIHSNSDNHRKYINFILRIVIFGIKRKIIPICIYACACVCVNVNT